MKHADAIALCERIVKTGYQPDGHEIDQLCVSFVALDLKLCELRVGLMDLNDQAKPE